MNFEFEVVKAPGYETFNPTKCNITVSGEEPKLINNVLTPMVFLEAESREDFVDGFTIRYRKMYIPETSWATIMAGSVINPDGSVNIDVAKIKPLFDAQKLTIIKQL